MLVPLELLLTDPPSCNKRALLIPDLNLGYFVTAGF